MDGSGAVFHKPFANMINAPFPLHDVVTLVSKRRGGRQGRENISASSAARLRNSI